MCVATYDDQGGKIERRITHPSIYSCRQYRLLLCLKYMHGLFGWRLGWVARQKRLPESFFLKEMIGRSLPIFFAFSINMYRRHTNVQITRLAKPKEKEERNATTGSLPTNLGALRCFCWPWYTPSQDPPWELLSSAREVALLSKINPFLSFQMVQQAEMKISLKIWLPKSVLAWMIMSKGCLRVAGEVHDFCLARQVWKNVFSWRPVPENSNQSIMILYYTYIIGPTYIYIRIKINYLY